MQIRNRRRHFFHFFILLFILIPANSYAQDSSEIETEEEKSSGFIPIPIVYYTPETGFGAGAGFYYYYRLPGESMDSRISSLSFFGSYTQYNQYFLALAPTFYFQNDDYFFKANIRHKKFPADFYGIGNDTPKGDLEKYTPLVFELLPDFALRLHKDLYAGVKYHYYWYDVIKTEDDGQLASGDLTGSKNGQASGVGILAFWDSRDKISSTYKGGYYRADMTWFLPAFGSDFGYTHINADMRTFIPLAEKHILAFQEILEMTIGDPPFELLPKLGGNQILRGIYEGRYRDKNAAMAQVEYRFPIYKWLSGATFAGVGDVAEYLSFLLPAEFKYAYGAGLRAQINKQERVRLRLDVGMSEEGPGFYFVFGEAF